MGGKHSAPITLGDVGASLMMKSVSGLSYLAYSISGQDDPDEYYSSPGSVIRSDITTDESRAYKDGAEAWRAANPNPKNYDSQGSSYIADTVGGLPALEWGAVVQDSAATANFQFSPADVAAQNLDGYIFDNESGLFSVTLTDDLLIDERFDIVGQDTAKGTVVLKAKANVGLPPLISVGYVGTQGVSKHSGINYLGDAYWAQDVYGFKLSMDPSGNEKTIACDVEWTATFGNSAYGALETTTRVMERKSFGIPDVAPEYSYEYSGGELTDYTPPVVVTPPDYNNVDWNPVVTQELTNATFTYTSGDGQVYTLREDGLAELPYEDGMQVDDKFIILGVQYDANGNSKLIVAPNTALDTMSKPVFTYKFAHTDSEVYYDVNVEYIFGGDGSYSINVLGMSEQDFSQTTSGQVLIDGDFPYYVEEPTYDDGPLLGFDTDTGSIVTSATLEEHARSVLERDNFLETTEITGEFFLDVPNSEEDTRIAMVFDPVKHMWKLSESIEYEFLHVSDISDSYDSWQQLSGTGDSMVWSEQEGTFYFLYPPPKSTISMTTIDGFAYSGEFKWDPSSPYGNSAYLDLQYDGTGDGSFTFGDVDPTGSFDLAFDDVFDMEVVVDDGDDGDEGDDGDGGDDTGDDPEEPVEPVDPTQPGGPTDDDDGDGIDNWEDDDWTGHDDWADGDDDGDGVPNAEDDDPFNEGGIDDTDQPTDDEADDGGDGEEATAIEDDSGLVVDGEPLRPLRSGLTQGGGARFGIELENQTIVYWEGPNHPETRTLIYGNWTGANPKGNELPVEVGVSSSNQSRGLMARGAGARRYSCLDTYMMAYHIDLFQKGDREDKNAAQTCIKRIERAIAKGNISSAIDPEEHAAADYVLRKLRENEHALSLDPTEVETIFGMTSSMVNTGTPLFHPSGAQLGGQHERANDPLLGTPNMVVNLPPRAKRALDNLFSSQTGSALAQRLVQEHASKRKKYATPEDRMYGTGIKDWSASYELLKNAGLQTTPAGVVLANALQAASTAQRVHDQLEDELMDVAGPYVRSEIGGLKGSGNFRLAPEELMGGAEGSRSAMATVSTQVASKVSAQQYMQGQAVMGILQNLIDAKA